MGMTLMRGMNTEFFSGQLVVVMKLRDISNLVRTRAT
jgi:hypothetical protein